LIIIKFMEINSYFLLHYTGFSFSWIRFGIVRFFCIWDQIMLRIILLLIDLIIFQTDAIDVHVFRLTFFWINWLYLFQKVSVCFLVLFKWRIYVASYSVSVSGISSITIILVSFLYFVYIVKLFIRRRKSFVVLAWLSPLFLGTFTWYFQTISICISCNCKFIQTFTCFW